MRRDPDRPAPLPLPVRVLVKGASRVNWMSPMGGPRSDMAFPRVIEAELGKQGRPSDVQAVTIASERSSSLHRTWQREVLQFSPDVIVLTHGDMEAVHLFLPRWLERHANSIRHRPRPLVRLYRRRVLRPAWMALAQLQQRVDRRVDATRHRRQVRRVIVDLEAYIARVQQVGSPLVLLLEPVPIGPRRTPWFPGMPARATTMTREIERLVARIDRPDVRFFGVTPLIDTYADGDLDAAQPDGFHYTPRMHRIIGEALAEEIEQWARTQPHLTPSSPEEDRP